MSAPLDDLVVPEHAALEQRRASDPAVSAWVSANAGAGKTKVLTDRVVRLLLAGAPPARILCLTFTKAAAANMAIRVFDRLGRWVTLTPEALARELSELQGRPPSRAETDLARRLFARAVETPGGLKIETIHAFCERLLHRVPFEANVPARFEVLDEERAAELVAEAIRTVLAGAARAGPPDLAEALRVATIEVAGDQLDEAMREALRQMPSVEAAGGVEPTLARLARRLRLGPADTAEAIEAGMIAGGLSRQRWTGIAAALRGSGAATDRDTAERFERAAQSADPAERLALYRTVFFRDNGDLRAESRICTQTVGEALKAELLAERDRLCALDDRLKAARTLERTRALLTLAAAIAARVRAVKQSLGVLDFDDLIARTREVLTGENAPWVLYKLDRGIDHLLVDEAQDTSPAQWAVLRAIAEEFTAGHGARPGVVRTLFAVGDPKQSIYGFQGAEPREFALTGQEWERKARGAALAFARVGLDLSFRSGRAILSAVDATFFDKKSFRGLSFEDGKRGTWHETARPRAPGLVELWPIELPGRVVEPDAWALPVDEPEPGSPAVLAAGRIAAAVRAWTSTGDGTGRIWRPGDILILVRKRGPAFEAIIRALKKARLPVAGQDRIELGSHIAAMDLVAIGRAVLLPDDDLTLATALKTPLLGLDDDDLVRIGARREDPQSLAAALARRAEEGDAVARDACERLAGWRALAGASGPFAFYATLLGPGGGRKRLVARLGGEAADAIDEFLSLARRAERAETPALATFLARLEIVEHAVKRELDPARDEVRVMTVHGAKGLEAPLVVLVDGCHVHGPPGPVLPWADGEDAPIPVWARGARHECGRLREGLEHRKARELEEHNRLLYVAMTRARDRLVIAPYGGRPKTPEEAWCEMVRRGLAAEKGGLVPDARPYGPVEVWRGGPPATAAAPAKAPAEPSVEELPDWLTRLAPATPEPPILLRPSKASGRADGASAGAAARRRGLLVHALLQKLPALAPELRDAEARAMVAVRAPRLAPAERQRILDDVATVLAHPDLEPLFGAGSRAEAPLAGRVRLGARDEEVSGQVDRLAVMPGEVLLADFKSGRAPEPGSPVPSAVATQLGLYRALLQGVHPDRPVRVFAVWTTGPVIREFDAELDEALERLGRGLPGGG